MTTQITAVVFDLGGVLIDWDPRHLYRKLFGADEAAMDRFLAEVCSPAWNARLDAGRPFADGVAELVEAHPDQAELISAYQLRWAEMLGEAFDGTVAILRELRRAGFATYALSNWSTETYPVTRPRYPFLDEMDGILISGEVGVGKPDPAIFRHFLERFRLTAENTVYIDDWDLNVATAAALGMTAILFRGAAELRRDLRSLGLPLAASESAQEAR
jgi:2-haloacid dehalogenase